MADYRIMGARYLRKYSEAGSSPVTAAAIEAQRIVNTLCDLPWERVADKYATTTSHSNDDESLDGNVENRDRFDAALFCAEHEGGMHRAFANAAVYAYELPDSAVGKSAETVKCQVNTDYYNSQGVRLHVWTGPTLEIPMSCRTVRGENTAGEIVDDGTTAAGVAKRTTRIVNSQEMWYTTSETVTLEPTGGLTLQKYLYILVALESYSTVRGNWLEGSSYIDNDVVLTLDSACGDLDATRLNDLSPALPTVEYPVVRYGVTQCRHGDVSGLCDVAVLLNGDGLADMATVADGQRWYRNSDLAPVLHKFAIREKRAYSIGISALYAKFYMGQMELAVPKGQVAAQKGAARAGAGFSVRRASWSLPTENGGAQVAPGWVLSASSIAIPFSVPLSLTVTGIKLAWGAAGNGTGGTVSRGNYTFWFRRGVYVDTLPESLVKNPDIYTGRENSVAGWERLGISENASDVVELPIDPPFKGRLASLLVTAFADQRGLPSADGAFLPYGASSELEVVPSGVSPDATLATGTCKTLPATGLMKPDISIVGYGDANKLEPGGTMESEEPTGAPLERYVCFTAVDDTVSTVSLSREEEEEGEEEPLNAPIVYLEYSMDGKSWQSFGYTTTVTLNGAGTFVLVRAQRRGNLVFARGRNNDYKSNFFSLSGHVSVSGDITALLDATTPVMDLSSKPHCFTGLFRDCTALYSAADLKLPATTLADYCYSSMFWGCTSLAAAPALLPAATLAYCCYLNMFRGCTSLTAAPELPATTLAAYCYSNMFLECASLTAAPDLPATTLVSSCYYYMFAKCTSLTIIDAYFTAFSPANATSGWLNQVPSNGTFRCPTALANSGFTRNGGTVPDGWTIETFTP